jgi:hypothetical protein
MKPGGGAVCYAAAWLCGGAVYYAALRRSALPALRPDMAAARSYYPDGDDDAVPGAASPGATSVSRLRKYFAFRRLSGVRIA